MSIVRLALFVAAVGVLAGCSTQGQFVVPPETSLEIYSRPVSPDSSGKVSMRPFGWNAAGIPPDRGVPYRLLKDNETVQEGRLRAVFRGASLFWPPFAILYWPMGLNPHITYDLVKGTQE